MNYIAEGVTVNNSLSIGNIPGTPKSTVTKKTRRTTYYDYNVAKNMYTVTVVTVTQNNGGAKKVKINAWNTASDWDINGQNAEQIANMSEDVAYNIGTATTGVVINPGASQTLDYVEVDDVYCYLINVGAGDEAQALRVDTNALEGNLEISNLLYEFYFSIKDSDDDTDGATIEYDYGNSIVFDPDAENDAGLFSFSNRAYNITVTTTQTVNPKVITMVTDNSYTVTLLPPPS